MTIWDRSAVIGAAVQTPRYPLVCNAIPEHAIEAVAGELALARPELEGVRGERDTALAFAEAWQARHRTAGSGDSRGAPLSARHTASADRTSTAQPATPPTATEVDSWSGWDSSSEKRSATSTTTAGTSSSKPPTAWGTDSCSGRPTGPPVSMAMLRVRAAGVSRIGPVFTPADRPWAGLRIGRHCRDRRIRLPRRRGRCRAVRRPGEPDIERNLSAHRIRRGRRFRADRVRAPSSD